MTEQVLLDGMEVGLAGIQVWVRQLFVLPAHSMGVCVPFVGVTANDILGDPAKRIPANVFT